MPTRQESVEPLLMARLKCDECGREVPVYEDSPLLGAERGKFYCCGWCEGKAEGR